ncbi:ataxin-2 homolog [Eurosta solidaginis]|uniref:ataxin-2 homolog n=1 Tax=Eurosta solidaginis TaxID=178769 RepID=UPI0035315921
MMNTQFFTFAFLVFALAVEALVADTGKDEQMEDSTESPIGDLAFIVPEVKSTTERPPTAAASATKNATTKSGEKQNVQPHTVADFIIHPLIAFKPRAPEDSFAGKQADGSSSTTPSPWSIFGFNAGQGLGSSVTSLAGSVSGWLNDRIQLPGLVESPIRDPSSSTSSTTTSTQRPDVIVRVQHKATTRRPIITINNRNRPQNFQNNNNFASDEYDDEYDEEDEFLNNNNKRRKNNKNQNNRGKPNRQQEEDESEESVEEEVNSPVRRPQQNQAPQKRRRRPFVEDDISEEADEDDDDEQEDDVASDEIDKEILQRPNKRRLVAQNNNKRRRLPQQQQWQPYYGGYQRRRLQKPLQIEDEDEEDDDGEVQFFYGSRPSTKRSKNEAGFFQRGQENIINQIRQLTRGQTPAEIGSLVRKSATTQQGASQKKQRQQTTLLVNRNGQTIYLAPELLNVDLPLVNTQVHHVVQNNAQAPQPPFSVPLKRKNAPTQYITIPWAQLGISPPDQLHSVTESVQTQPLIINIPASVLQTIQNQSLKRKKQPVITAEAVPLLAEASIVDVFKPPTFPNDRHSAEKPSASSNPVLIASKKKTSTSTMPAKSSVLPQRIRSGTFVEKAPVSADRQQEASDDISTAESVRNVEKQYIHVGEDADLGLGRQVQTVLGDAHDLYSPKASPYVGLFRRGQFDVRRNGRDLDTANPSEQQDVVDMPNGEKLIPVQIISEPEMVVQPKEVAQPALQDTETQKGVSSEQSESQKEVTQQAIDASSIPAQKEPAA